MSSFFSDAKEKVSAGAESVKETAKEVKEAPLMPVPAYADIAKAANDLLNKDFYHVAAHELEVKTKAPNGVTYTVKGKASAPDKAPTGSIETKYSDKARGTTGTLTWSTLNALDAKLELDNNIANGLKVEALSTFLPATNSSSAKVNIHFKQPAFHFRAFVDLLKGPTANVDFVTGHEGFLVGGEAGYDVQKAAVTRYSAAIGFTQANHNAAVVASSNLSIFAASYYNRINSQVEVGAKATWDSKTSSAVGLELASKYVIDPLSFAKAKVDDRGIAALSYNVKVKEGFTFGLGASFDTQKLNEATHKVGVKFAFEG